MLLHRSGRMARGGLYIQAREICLLHACSIRFVPPVPTGGSNGRGRGIPDADSFIPSACRIACAASSEAGFAPAGSIRTVRPRRSQNDANRSSSTPSSSRTAGTGSIPYRFPIDLMKSRDPDGPIGKPWIMEVPNRSWMADPT